MRGVCISRLLALALQVRLGRRGLQRHLPLHLRVARGPVPLQPATVALATATAAALAACAPSAPHLLASAQRHLLLRRHLHLVLLGCRRSLGC